MTVLVGERVLIMLIIKSCGFYQSIHRIGQGTESTGSADDSRK